MAPRVAQMPDPEFRKRTAIRLNACLLVQNVIVSAAVIYAGVLAIEQFDRAEETFLLNARLVKDPLPCAIPTPDIYYLFQGLGLADTSILHSVSRDTWMDRVEYALCHASYSQSSVGSTDAAYDCVPGEQRGPSSWGGDSAAVGAAEAKHAMNTTVAVIVLETMNL